MNRLLGVTILIICSLISNFGHSQELSFDSQNFDFGTIAEDGGIVSHIFSYKNIGTSPAVIVTAISSCGCTVPKYSRQPIAAGAAGELKVNYDPMDRPGKFSKTIQVVIAPSNKKYMLTISGDATPRKRSVEETYPFEMGKGVRFAANYYALSHIGQGENRKSQVPYINTSKHDVTISLRPNTVSGLLETDLPKRVAAGQSGSFEIGYDLKKNQGRYGTFSDKYFIDIDDKEAKYQLMVNGHGIDSFSEDERSAPPIANRDKSTLQFGEIKRGNKSQKLSFKLENSGVRDLIIRHVDVGANITSSVKAGDRVAADQAKSFDVWLDSEGVTFGSVSRYLTLTVNDPDQPVIRVRATAIVVD